MRVASGNGLIYDESNPLCTLTLSESQGEVYAFITVVQKHNPEQTKRYWGRYDLHDKEASLIEIMEVGGKWPRLPD